MQELFDLDKIDSEDWKFNFKLL